MIEYLDISTQVLIVIVAAVLSAGAGIRFVYLLSKRSQAK